jgi:hypothetical protein
MLWLVVQVTMHLNEVGGLLSTLLLVWFCVLRIKADNAVIVFHVSVAKEVIIYLSTSPNEVTKIPATSLCEACFI